MTNPNLPERMKAQVINAYNEPYTLTTLPLPHISSEHEILIKVEAAGYCHSDETLAAGDRANEPRSFPHVGGHELAATVVALAASPSATAKQFQIGSRVGAPGRGFGACGACFECTNPSNAQPGYSFFCPQTLSNGFSKDGGFAEYAVVDARQCVLLPSDLSSIEAAPLMCAGVTIFKAIKRANLVAGQRLGIVGCGGGLGHLGLQFADAMGLKVTGVDAADAALKLASSLKTSATIVDPRSVTAEQVLEQIGKEDGKAEIDKADTGLDAVLILPENQAGFDYGLKLLRNHGLCVAVSLPKRGFVISGEDYVFRDIRIHGTILGTDADLKETVEFAAKHGIKPVLKTFKLEELNDVVELHRNGYGGKLVIDFEKE
jgi:propanol-preferring alcohol dehydrogenase